MRPRKDLLLDGRTGEGGGQLVRMACALAAVTSQPVCIGHVRGNRSGGGGLKAQHCAAINWLASVTNADVDGLSVGSQVLKFRPQASPAALKQRNFTIAAESSGASTLLIFQCIFPFLLFAGNSAGEPVELEIHGGTNCSFSLSYEYLDQVLLPTLQERYDITVERQLQVRGWTVGPKTKGGCVRFRFKPIAPGQTLRLVKPWPTEVSPKDFEIEKIDVSVLAPSALRRPLHDAINHHLDTAFPGTQVELACSEETMHPAQLYALAVAHSRTGLRWGQDYLYDQSTKNKKPEKIALDMARTISKRLRRVIDQDRPFDEHLEDQLVVFTALADATTDYPVRLPDHSGSHHKAETDAKVAELMSGMESLLQQKRLKKDKTHQPFGDGSTHTTTARWVVSELMPTVEWFNRGAICKGAGVSFDLPVDDKLPG